MLLLSHIVVTVIAVLNTKWIVSCHAQSTTDDNACINQNEILNSDTELDSLYPRNVSCANSFVTNEFVKNDTLCTIDFNSVAGVEDYSRRCYELQGRIVLFNWTNFAPDIDVECYQTTYKADHFSFTNDPKCLGSKCSRDFASWELPRNRLDELGITTCGYKSDAFETASDADRSWTHITISIVAVAVAVSLL
jgi:hypothetical protein